ncbi:hypothetical protein D3C87_1385930 [compost metagenome]
MQARTDRGARLATTAAISSARGIRASGAVIWLISPASRARLASMGSPVRIISAASAAGIVRGRRVQPPPPASTPTLISGSPKRALAEAIRMSQARASSRPPPSATPLIAARTGLLVVARCVMPQNCGSSRPAATLRLRWGSSSGMSAPAQKALLPAPVTTMQRTPASASSSAKARAISWSVAGSIALYFSGREIVRSPTPGAGRVISMESCMGNSFCRWP